jgi:toxin ParE1/3/4
VRSVRYHPEARDEFLREIEYYAAISPRLAARFDKSVRIAETLVAASPEAWPKYQHTTRRLVERAFKFSLVYLHTDSEIYVVAVASTNRKPGYWKDRIVRV